MDAAVAKVRRIEIIYNDGKSDIIRQIEPVKYFSDLGTHLGRARTQYPLISIMLID
jgi:hypothetical protein